MIRNRLGIALAAVCICVSTSSCIGDDTVETMESLPIGAVGAINVGTNVLTAQGKSEMETIVFDGGGSRVGSIRGKALVGARLESWDRGLVASSARSVTTLNGQESRAVPIDEMAMRGAASQGSSGDVALWFNTGGGGGEGGYTNKYVTLRGGELATEGEVPGYMFSAAVCGLKDYGIASNLNDFGDGPVMKYSLYELGAKGASSHVLNSWEAPNNLRPATTATHCTPDDQTLLTFYKSVTGESSLSIGEIDIPNGTVDFNKVDVGDNSATIRDDTLSVANGRIYWVNNDNVILSIPMNGKGAAKKEANLPGDAKNTKVAVASGTVALLNPATAVYAEYDIVTGDTRRAPMRLSWLSDAVGALHGDAEVIDLTPIVAS